MVTVQSSFRDGYSAFDKPLISIVNYSLKPNSTFIDTFIGNWLFESTRVAVEMSSKNFKKIFDLCQKVLNDYNADLSPDHYIQNLSSEEVWAGLKIFLFLNL